MEKRVIRNILLAIMVLYMFLLGIKLMGSSFKLFGNGFAENLVSVTSNPFVALFIGLLATAVVQSSSLTTALVVGLTAAGSLSIGNAIPIIMGANLGTSITNTIVSLGHITRKGEFRKAVAAATVHDFFNFIVVLILFPLELLFHPLQRIALYLTDLVLGSSISVGFSSPLDYIIKPVVGYIKVLFGSNVWLSLGFSLLILFLSLRYFVKLMQPLAQTEFRHILNKRFLQSPMKGFVFGFLLTAMVQSSSVSTSLIVPLAGAGMLSLRRIFPYILGANIGTTLTALIASLVSGAAAGVTVALVHLLFNVFGSFLVYPLRDTPISMSMYLAKLSSQCRIYPIAYVASAFFILPLCIIWLVAL